MSDALSHQELFTLPDLADYYRTHRGLRGVRQLPQVIELTEPKAESPMETRVRLLIVLAGLPRPEPQLHIRDLHGTIIARADLGYVAERVIVEYDGAWHWEQRRADDRRRDTIRDLGWDVIVVSREDYYETPARIVERVRSSLAKRAA